MEEIIRQPQCREDDEILKENMKEAETFLEVRLFNARECYFWTENSESPDPFSKIEMNRKSEERMRELKRSLK